MKIFSSFFYAFMFVTISINLCAMESDRDITIDNEKISEGNIYSKESQELLETLCISDIALAQEKFKTLYKKAILLVAEFSFVDLDCLLSEMPAESYASIALKLAYAKHHHENLCTRDFGQTIQITKAEVDSNSPIYTNSVVIEQTSYDDMLNYVKFITKENITCWVNPHQFSRCEKTSPLFCQKWIRFVLPFLEFVIEEPVENISLSYLGLTEIPYEIGLLSNLKCISVDNNKLSTFPKTIVNLTNLSEIYAEKNNFDEYPQILNSMSHLTVYGIKN